LVSREHVTHSGQAGAHGPRHAASGRDRGTKTPTASRALSAPHLDHSAVKSRAQTQEPRAFLLSPSASAWQTIMRAAQTRAFAVALLIALATSSLVATVAPRGAQTHTPPSPPAGVTSAPQNSPTAERQRGPAAPVIAHTGVPRSEQPDRLDRLPIPAHHSESPVGPPNLDASTDGSDLDAALNELDRQADRDRAWASQNPGTAPIPEP
jgi:hypothetical protein